MDRPRRRLLPRGRGRVFGDGTKVKFTPLTAKDRFTALQSGEIDILSRNTTWTINRDTALGLNFAGVTYYDGQGFMVNARSCRASTRRCSSPAPRSACSPARRPSSTSPTTSRPTTWSTTRSSSRSWKRSTPPMTPAAATPTRPTSRASTRIRLTLAAPGRSRRAARDHLQGAARTGRPPGRRPVVRHRQVDLLRAAQRRGTRHHPGQCRGDEDFGESRRSSASSASKPRPRSAPTSASTTTGSSTSSRPSATTARSSSATSAPAARSRSRAASTRCGPRAACSTARRSADRR